MDGEKKPFTVHPKHWWTYLNPFWWKRKKFIETVIAYQWVQGGEKIVTEKIFNYLMYGDKP